jgi:hypothetical protein
VKLDATKLSDEIKSVVAAGPKPTDWARALRGKPASQLAAAVRAFAAAAVDKPTVKKSKQLVVKEPFFHHGTLEVTGNLRVVAPFVVTGDVRVSGVMMDCGPDSAVAIGGNVQAASLHTSGELACGNIDAPDGVVYGHYNDNTLDCMRIRARVVIADEHDIQASSVVAKIDYSDLSEYRQGYGDGVLARLRKVFVDDVFQEADGEPATLDHHVLFARLMAGKPVYKTKAKAKKKSAKPKRRGS